MEKYINEELEKESTEITKALIRNEFENINKNSTGDKALDYFLAVKAFHEATLKENTNPKYIKPEYLLTNLGFNIGNSIISLIDSLLNFKVKLTEDYETKFSIENFIRCIKEKEYKTIYSKDFILFLSANILTEKELYENQLLTFLEFVSSLREDESVTFNINEYLGIETTEDTNLLIELTFKNVKEKDFYLHYNVFYNNNGKERRSVTEVNIDGLLAIFNIITILVASIEYNNKIETNILLESELDMDSAYDLFSNLAKFIQFFKF